MNANVFLAGVSPKPEKPASDVLDSRQHISVYHPGYNPHPLLLYLVAFLASPGSCGVPFSVVLDACRILANNRDGTLRVMDDATDLTPPDDESLLSPGSYTYHVTEGETAYAVCTSFRAWTPPKVLPPHWDLDVMGTTAVFLASSASSYSTAVKMVDGCCAVTGDCSRLQSSHLVPEVEEAWWILRGMSGLTGNPEGINSLPNCLATRADLNGQGMDQGHFVFAPYAGKAVCVCLTHGMPDFAADYHLRAVKIPTRINPMNVYVRFAWGLFRALPNVLRELTRRPNVVIVAEPTFLPASDRPPATKRSRTEDKSVPRGTQERNADGGNEKQEQDDEAPMLTDDDGSHQEASGDAPLEHPLDLYTLTERDLEAAEGLDADLDSRPLGEPYDTSFADFGQLAAGSSARYEEAAGIYRGFSKIMRLQHEYRQLHPEVSAVGSARVASVWEEDDEQRL
ncbi:hypothetical protein B0H15DRAFT_946296 [Mycena belliarum]|uniref:HNH nuclease domain-containing protein n=1 Tax=Mycena belliarum TaxID=1033014 RepID=A0AAD6UE82_9AGAR|nr:hypothetical protein B0H15DRAFT_946296 [Mycena belliae]